MSDFETAFADVLETVSDEHFDRSRFVPGAGPHDAAIALVGEAPGEEEVEQGEPFVGSAGRRLDSVLEDLGVDPSGLYVTNVVKVRPPENRTPYVAEIDAWRPVLSAELDRIAPEVVVPLGTTATQALLDVDEGITAVHGQRFEQDDRVVIPVFHPAATFYDESKRPELAADLETAFDAI